MVIPWLLCIVAENTAMVIHGRRMRDKTLRYRHGEGGLL